MRALHDTPTHDCALAQIKKDGYLARPYISQGMIPVTPKEYDNLLRATPPPPPHPPHPPLFGRHANRGPKKGPCLNLITPTHPPTHLCRVGDEGIDERQDPVLEVGHVRHQRHSVHELEALKLRR